MGELSFAVGHRDLLGLEFAGNVCSKVSVWSWRLEGRWQATVMGWGLGGVVRLDVNLESNAT